MFLPPKNRLHIPDKKSSKHQLSQVIKVIPGISDADTVSSWQEVRWRRHGFCDILSQASKLALSWGILFFFPHVKNVYFFYNFFNRDIIVYNIVLASAVQWSESVIRIHRSTLPLTSHWPGPLKKCQGHMREG